MTENPMVEALSKGTFNVLEVVKGRGYPQDIVTVYTDHDAAFQIHKLEKQIANEKDGDKVNELDAVRAELVEKVKASGLTFHLRGISQGHIESVQKKATAEFGEDDTADKGRWTNFNYLAQHIVSVTDAEGNKDGHQWTVEEVFSLFDLLPDESFQKLHSLMIDLSFAARYFDEAVGTDF